MKKIGLLLILSLYVTGCTKDNEDFKSSYTGMYYRYSRMLDSNVVTETADTLPLTVQVQHTADSIFFTGAEPNVNGRFPINSEQFYKVPNISNRPYHIFKFVGDSLWIDFSWAAPSGPDMQSQQFRGVRN